MSAQQEILKSCEVLLRSTLGDMSPNNADTIVSSVADILHTLHTKTK